MKRICFSALPKGRRLLGLGHFCRGSDPTDFWRITAHFDQGPGQTEPVPLDVEMLSLLALGRTFNVVEGKAPFTRMKFAKIINFPWFSEWSEQPLGQFPRLSRAVACNPDLANQKCFVTEQQGITYWLPKFELARKLFFHAGFLTRAALVPNGLDMLFNVSTQCEGYDKKISTPSKVGVPASYFRRNEYRQFFSWLLLEDNIRESFESIWQCVNKGKYFENGYWRWAFDFVPPKDIKEFIGVVRGPLFQDVNAMLVWEIDSFWNLNCGNHGRVLFFHPDIRRTSKQKALTLADTENPEGDNVDVQIEVDSEGETKSGQRVLLDLPSERLQFSTVTETRVFYNPPKPYLVDTGINEDLFLVGTKDDSEEGLLKPIDLAQLGEDNLMAHHARFGPLIDAIMALEQSEQIQLTKLTVAALPKMKRCKHYMLGERVPRCYLLARFLVGEDCTRYLLEIDTSDQVKPLSTKLLELKAGLNERQVMAEILAHAVKRSLQWPVLQINKYCSYATEVVHPRFAKGPIREESAARWKRRLGKALLAGVARRGI